MAPTDNDPMPPERTGAGPADYDARGLIRESYNIEGITGAECRSIFLDWAINMEAEPEAAAQIKSLIDHYGPAHPDHPMTATLQAGLAAPTKRGRRGGARARR